MEIKQNKHLLTGITFFFSAGKKHAHISGFGFVLFAFLCLAPFSANSQNDDVDITFHQGGTTPTAPKPPREFLRNISVGGNLGLAFGNYTIVSVKPEAAYHFLKDWMAAGLGINYTFLRDNQYSINDHSFGGKAFLEGHLFNYVGLRLEYEAINYQSYTNGINNHSREWANKIGVGGGLHYKMGRWMCYLLLMYDFSNIPQYTGLSYTAGVRVFLKE